MRAGGGRVRVTVRDTGFINVTIDVPDGENVRRDAVAILVSMGVLHRDDFGRVLATASFDVDRRGQVLRDARVAARGARR